MTGHADAATLALLREGLLAPAEAAQVRSHLAGCARCRETESGLVTVTQMLASVQSPPMPAAVSARIAAALAAEAAARRDTAAPLEAAAAGGPPGTPAAPDTPAATGTPVTRQVPAAAGPGAPAASAAGKETAASATGGGPARDGTAPGALARTQAGSPLTPAAASTFSSGRPHSAGGTGVRPGAGRPPGRPRRPLPRSRTLARALAAAAVAVVLAGGSYGFTRLAAHPGGTGGGAQAASSTAQRPAPGAAMPAMGPNQGRAGEAAYATVASGTRYTAHRFASQVRALLARYAANGAARRSSAGPARPGGLPGRPAVPGVPGLAGCIHAVTGGQPARLVDFARYQGRPAVIIVAGTPGSALRAWAVSRDCSAISPAILAMVTLPAAR
jgi:hypothetical protein